MSALNFRPLHDMILVKPDHLDDKIGSIFVPMGALKAGDKPGDYHDSFVGTVMAIGPGDRHKPMEAMRCRACHKKRNYDACTDSWQCGCAGHGASYRMRAFNVGPIYPGDSDKWNAGRYLMVTKVGDRVLFPRRPNTPGGEFSVMIEGEKYMMFNEEQSAFAVIEA